MEAGKTIIVNTCATGYASDDEILHISILDLEGNIVLDTPVSPERHPARPRPRREAPTMTQLRPMLTGILGTAGLVVGYNTYFVMAQLAGAGFSVRRLKSYDVEKEFTQFFAERQKKLWSDIGDPNQIYNAEIYRNMSLDSCAAYLGYEWPEDAHQGSIYTLEEARLILFCYERLQALTS